MIALIVIITTAQVVSHFASHLQLADCLASNVAEQCAGATVIHTSA